MVESELAVDDESTARDNLNALIDFFNKFSELRDYDFYIAGESYGGIYVPTLARLILKYNENVSASKKIKLKGILVGNGVADWNYDTEPALYDFVFTHHLISYELRLEFVEYCKKNVDKEKCDKIKEKINQNIEGINIYDILQECQNSTSNDKNNNNNFIEIIKDQNIKKKFLRNSMYRCTKHNKIFKHSRSKIRPSRKPKHKL